jgi:tetratricopeptide (TPR) repeat protein
LLRPRRRTFVRAGWPALLGFLAAGVLADGEIDHARQYGECMALAERNPEQGFEAALGWRGLGGGDAADHCTAAALLGLKLYIEAANRFEALAQRTKAAAVKAGLLGQAAQAWLLAGRPERADDVLTAALKLAPDDGDLLVDRSMARATMRRYGEAVADLDRAIRLAPRRADAHAFRASAHRFLDRLDLAEADVARALALDPRHPEALLERGILARLRGDDGGARRDWVQVLELAPGSAAAEAAQRNLELMDVKQK